MGVQQPSSVNEGFLYESGPGRIYYCACSERVVLEFKGKYLVFRRAVFRFFLRDFSVLLQCPALRNSLAESGRLDIEGCNGRISLEMTPGEASDLFHLMDTTALFLDAQTAARKPLPADIN